MKKVILKLVNLLIKKPLRTQINKILDSDIKLTTREYSICLMFSAGIPFSTMSKWLNISEKEIKIVLINLIKENL